MLNFHDSTKIIGIKFYAIKSVKPSHKILKSFPLELSNNVNLFKDILDVAHFNNCMISSHFHRPTVPPKS